MSKFLFLGQNLFPELEKDKMGSQDKILLLFGGLRYSFLIINHIKILNKQAQFTNFSQPFHRQSFT